MADKEKKSKITRPNFVTEGKNTRDEKRVSKSSTLDKESLRKLRNARKKWKELNNRDGYYVFFLGKSGSSKSTILASICLYLQNNYRVLQSKNSKQGILYISDLIESIGNGDFPELTDYYTLIDYELKVEINDGENDFNITFIELAGEDIEKFSKHSENRFQEDMEAFIEKNNEKIIFLLVLPYNVKKADQIASEFDSTYVQFLSRIEGKCKNIGIITSKWDLNRKSNALYEDAISFIRDKYRSVLSWTENHDNCFVSPFSVGEVIYSRKIKKYRIKKLRLDYCANLINWIMMTTVLSPMIKKIEEDSNIIESGIAQLSESVTHRADDFSRSDHKSKFMLTLNSIESKAERLLKRIDQVKKAKTMD